jgi:hypothetical protein
VQIPKGRQYMFHFKGATVVLVLLISAAALAQSGTPVTYTYDASVTNQVTVNQCSVGEPVALNGTVHFSYSFTTDSSGVNQFTVSAANTLTGVGQNTGTPYVADDSDQYTSNTSDLSADLTVELRSNLKSQGSAPSLILVQSLHVTVDVSGNISAQVVGNSTNCGS